MQLESTAVRSREERNSADAMTPPGGGERLAPDLPHKGRGELQDIDSYVEDGPEEFVGPPV